jgi:hypothetical protein
VYTTFELLFLILIHNSNKSKESQLLIKTRLKLKIICNKKHLRLFEVKK